MQYKAVLFDLDGTLLDTLGDLHSAVNFALRSCGFPERSLAEIRSFVGNGVRLLVERSVPSGTSPDAIAECLSAFRAEYDLHMNVLTSPYDGVIDLLRSLQKRGMKIAVVSNKYDKAAKALVEAHFGSLVDICLGTLDGVPPKPAPDTANRILAALNLCASDAAYVGDSGVDFQTATNAGLPFYGVSWGFWDRDRLEACGAARICDSAGELYAALTCDTAD